MSQKPTVPWWKLQAAARIERQEDQARVKVGQFAGASFLIVTEGTVSEPTYFRRMRSQLGLGAVRVVVRSGDSTEPFEVVDTAVRLREEQVKRSRRNQLGADEPSKFDYVWAFLDTDVAHRLGRWSDLIAHARKQSVFLACSTPTFEYWLTLHLEYSTAPLQNGDCAKARMAELAPGYSTKQADCDRAYETFLDRWPDAVERAKRVRAYHRDGATRSPCNPSTEIDRLVAALNFSAPPPAQRIKAVDCKRYDLPE